MVSEKNKTTNQSETHVLFPVLSHAPSLPLHSPDTVMIKSWGTEVQAMQYTRKTTGLRAKCGLAG